jgi:hypothetical protein
MVNGRIAQEMAAQELAADTRLQERLLGVRSSGRRDERLRRAQRTPEDARHRQGVHRPRGLRESGTPTLDDWRRAPCAATTAGTRADTAAPVHDVSREPAARSGAVPRASRRCGHPAARTAPSAQVFEFPVAASSDRAAYVAGTFDTKGRELFFLRSA